MPSTSTILTFLNLCIYYISIATSTIFKYVWVSPSCVVISENTAYLRLLGPITLHVRYETMLRVFVIRAEMLDYSVTGIIPV